MAGCFEVFCCVAVLRVVAAADVTAGKAKPQAHPRVPYLYAVLADRDVLRMHIANLVFVCTGFLWHSIHCSKGQSLRGGVG